MGLGYDYLSLKDPKIARDKSTNIFTDIFHQSIKSINPELSDTEAKQCNALMRFHFVLTMKTLVRLFMKN